MSSAATDHQSLSTEPLWFESPGRSDEPIRIGDFRITVESRAMPGVGRIAVASPVVLAAATLSSGALAMGWLGGHTGSAPVTERLPVHSRLAAEPRFAGLQAALAVETEMAAGNTARTAARAAALKPVGVKSSADRADSAGEAGSVATPHPAGAAHGRVPKVKTVAPGLGTSPPTALAHPTSAEPDQQSPSFEETIDSARLTFARLEQTRRSWRWDSSSHFHHNHPKPTTPAVPVDRTGGNGTTDPTTADPGAANQGTSEPTTTEPGPASPGTEPTSTDPGTANRGTTDPTTTARDGVGVTADDLYANGAEAGSTSTTTTSPSADALVASGGTLPAVPTAPTPPVLVPPASGEASPWLGTFQASYTAASPGSTVTVPCGTYPADTITGQNAGAVTFRSATPHCVVVRTLNLGANNGSPSGMAPSNVTLDGIDIMASSGSGTPTTAAPPPARPGSRTRTAMCGTRPTEAGESSFSRLATRCF